MEFLEKLNKANRELRKNLQGVKVLGRCKCCSTCTLYDIKEDHYVAWRIFNSGMNRNIEGYKQGIRQECYALWDLTGTQLDIATEILEKYFEVEKPIDNLKTIIIKNK